MLKKLINRFKRKKAMKKYLKEDDKIKRYSEDLSNISNKMKSDSDEFTKESIKLGSDSIKMGMEFEESINRVKETGKSEEYTVKLREDYSIVLSGVKGEEKFEKIKIKVKRLDGKRRGSKKNRVQKKLRKRISKECIEYMVTDIDVKRMCFNRRFFKKEQRRKERERIKNEQNKNRS